MILFPLIIIAGPSGVGKTTVIKELLRRNVDYRASVTYTTRPARKKSTEDKIMHHVSQAAFDDLRRRGEFLEWATVHGYLYGTHGPETEKLLHGHPVILNIDVEGARQIRGKFGDRVIGIFILPESREQMIERIKKRGDITEKELSLRLASADKELRRQSEFEYTVVNREGKLEDTLTEIQGILDKKIRV